ncbi:MAG: hypothetical protein QM578_12235 [Pantoea sp.]|uniref:hypothetical protein n=1 Tax=Pantoea sp. TaxID=69393 RepID=UPI0003AC8821|nr:hypothetical protein L579_2298 [Pantoea sp. AS-PWVM4]
MAMIAVEGAVGRFLLLKYSAIGLNLARAAPIIEKIITGYSCVTNATCILFFAVCFFREHCA